MLVEPRSTAPAADATLQIALEALEHSRGLGYRHTGPPLRRLQAQSYTTGQLARAFGVSVDAIDGTAFLHTVIDDHSRVAYAEICTDERAATAIGVLRLAVAWFADRGISSLK